MFEISILSAKLSKRVSFGKKLKFSKGLTWLVGPGGVGKTTVLGLLKNYKFHFRQGEMVSTLKPLSDEIVHVDFATGSCSHTELKSLLDAFLASTNSEDAHYKFLLQLSEAIKVDHKKYRLILLDNVLCMFSSLASKSGAVSIIQNISKHTDVVATSSTQMVVFGPQVLKPL